MLLQVGDRGELAMRGRHVRGGAHLVLRLLHVNGKGENNIEQLGHAFGVRILNLVVGQHVPTRRLCTLQRHQSGLPSLEETAKIGQDHSVSRSGLNHVRFVDLLVKAKTKNDKVLVVLRRRRGDVVLDLDGVEAGGMQCRNDVLRGDVDRLQLIALRDGALQRGEVLDRLQDAHELGVVVEEVATLLQFQHHIAVQVLKLLVVRVEVVLRVVHQRGHVSAVLFALPNHVDRHVLQSKQCQLHPPSQCLPQNWCAWALGT